MKPASSSSTLSTPLKLKTLVHTLTISQLCCFGGAISRAKSIVKDLMHHLVRSPKSARHKCKKILFRSFRMHCNWCSSHNLPEAKAAKITTGESSQALSGYLHWLEEAHENSSATWEVDINEIDRLADVFIASCHEKFRLEKEGAYRRYQEMLVRSI